MIISEPIRSREQLSDLRKWSARRGIRRVALELDADPALLRRAETRINRNLQACGCEFAAILVAIALGVSATAVVIGVASGHPLDLAHYGWMGAAVVGAAIVGKAAGTAYSELVLKRAIKEVLASETGGPCPKPARRMSALPENLT